MCDFAAPNNKNKNKILENNTKKKSVIKVVKNIFLTRHGLIYNINLNCKIVSKIISKIF